MIALWTRRKAAKRWAAQPAAPYGRFDAATAVPISNADELAAMAPGFRRSLSVHLGVEALAGRLNPIQLDDDSVAIFALAEHVASDQADELAHRIVLSGYSPACPARYVLAAPLLLAIARQQLTAASLSGVAGATRGQSRTALAHAFQDLVEWGVRQGASDIHLNLRLQEPESEVKYTVCGRYLAPERFRRMPTSTLLDMLSVAWMDIRGGNGAVFDPFAEQQGSMTRRVDGREVTLRWASLAAEAGPSVCLRLLQRDAASRLPDLDHLGYLPDQIQLIDRVMLSEGGAVVFAGTVGSGKSTSLASLIARLPGHRKVITMEDPVEYTIPGAIQNSLARRLDADAHDSYAAKLRALKRSAMTDVLLGEVRDRETGRAFMDLAGAGVNVYTTVHAPSAALIPQRLASDFIGVSKDFLTTPGMLKLLVFQALLPALCRHCASPVRRLLETGGNHLDGRHMSPPQWRTWLESIEILYAEDSRHIRIRNPQGCDACRQPTLPELNGYVGRTVAAELLEPALAVQHARSAMDCAMLKVFRGEIDPRDVEVRFHAFETQRLAVRQDSPNNAAAPRLWAVT